MVYYKKRKMMRAGRKVRGRRPYRARARFGMAVHAPKHFCETIKIRDIVSKASNVAQGYNNSITASAVNNLNASLSEVFNQFCITGIKLMYLPTFNTYSTVGTSIFIPKIFYAEDKSDNATPTAAAYLMQQDNCKILDSSKKFTTFISFPRPYADSLLGDDVTQPVIVQPASRGIQWVSFGAQDDPGQDVQNGKLVEWLNSVMLVEGNTGVTDVTVGQLWAKVYYSCKEQR